MGGELDYGRADRQRLLAAGWKEMGQKLGNEPMWRHPARDDGFIESEALRQLERAERKEKGQ